MTKTEALEKIIPCAKRAFRYSGNDLTEDTVISETLGTNSMMRIALCAMLEEELGVMVSVVEFGRCRTLGDLADKVVGKQS